MAKTHTYGFSKQATTITCSYLYNLQLYKKGCREGVYEGLYVGGLNTDQESDISKCLDDFKNF